MKKRMRAEGRRASSTRRSSRRSVSRRRDFSRSGNYLGSGLRDTYDKVREKVFTREVTFILLVLFGGMIFFDAVGYDYTGMVVSSLGPEAITGAQTAGDLSGLSEALNIIPNVFFAFLTPVAGLFTGENSTLLWRVLLGLLFYFIVFNVLKRMEALGEERNKKIITAILAIAFGSLLPGNLIDTLFGDSGATGSFMQLILTVIFAAIGFYFTKWLYGKTGESARFGRLIGFVAAIVGILFVMFLRNVFVSYIFDQNIRTIFDLIWGVTLLALIIVAFRSLIFSATPTESDMERMEKRQVEKEAGFEFGERKRKNEEYFRSKQESDRFKINATKNIKSASKHISTLLNYIGSKNDIDNKQAKSVVAAVNGVWDAFSETSDPANSAELANMGDKLRSFEEIADRVKRLNPSTKDLNDAQNALKFIQASISRLKV